MVSRNMAINTVIYFLNYGKEALPQFDPNEVSLLILYILRSISHSHKALASFS